MATDFTNNNTTISASGGLQPGTRNTPLDVRTRVNLKADIDSIPNPFVGMKIIVLQDETNDNQMTEYVVVSLKANSLGIADSKINEVVLAKDFLGVSGASGSGMTSEQVQQLNTAYTHSQTPHVQQSDIPTKTSQLQNDSNFISSIPEEYVTEQELNAKGFATETFVTNKINEAQLGGGEGTTVDLSGLGADLSLNGQTLKLKNSNGTEIGTGVTLPQTDLTNYYTKTETDNIIQDYTGGKKQVYLTQAEYDQLIEADKNDSTKVYNITDATEQVIPTDLTIDSNNLLQLKDSKGNTIGTGVTVSTTSGGSSSYTLPIASSTVLGGIKVGNNLSIDSNGVLSATITGTGSGMTDDEIDTVLTNVFGEDCLPQVYGNIVASVNELSINEGQSGTFTVSLSQVPTRPQTITISSNNTDVIVNPSSIDISDTNPHTITVTTSEDEDYDNDSAILTLSSPNVSNVTVNVTVVDNDIEPIHCTGITLDQTSLSLTKGNTQQLIATVTPDGCTDEIIWSTNNNNCTVENGLVTAITEGDCVITATCGQQSATCNVNVSGLSAPAFNKVLSIDSTCLNTEANTLIDNVSGINFSMTGAPTISDNKIVFTAADTFVGEVRSLGLTATTARTLRIKFTPTSLSHAFGNVAIIGSYESFFRNSDSIYINNAELRIQWGSDKTITNQTVGASSEKGDDNRLSGLPELNHEYEIILSQNSDGTLRYWVDGVLVQDGTMELRYDWTYLSNNEGNNRFIGSYSLIELYAQYFNEYPF